MHLVKFGNLYLDPNKLLYVERFMPEIMSSSHAGAGLRLGFEQREITIYDDDPGYAELVAWLEANNETSA